MPFYPIPYHNYLQGLDGGTIGQYYHLTSTTYGYLNQDVTSGSTPTFASINGIAGTNFTLTSNVVDGASAIGLKVNTTNSFTNTTSKLLSVQNNSAERLYNYVGSPQLNSADLVQILSTGTVSDFAKKGC